VPSSVSGRGEHAEECRSLRSLRRVDMFNREELVDALLAAEDAGDFEAAAGLSGYDRRYG
jgi:hypothetical protein